MRRKKKIFEFREKKKKNKKILESSRIVTFCQLEYRRQPIHSVKIPNDIYIFQREIFKLIKASLDTERNKLFVLAPLGLHVLYTRRFYFSSKIYIYIYIFFFLVLRLYCCFRVSARIYLCLSSCFFFVFLLFPTRVVLYKSLSHTIFIQNKKNTKQNQEDLRLIIHDV